MEALSSDSIYLSLSFQFLPCCPSCSRNMEQCAPKAPTLPLQPACIIFKWWIFSYQSACRLLWYFRPCTLVYVQDCRALKEHQYHHTKATFLEYYWFWSSFAIRLGSSHLGWMQCKKPGLYLLRSMPVIMQLGQCKQYHMEINSCQSFIGRTSTFLQFLNSWNTKWWPTLTLYEEKVKLIWWMQALPESILTGGKGMGKFKNDANKMSVAVTLQTVVFIKENQYFMLFFGEKLHKWTWNNFPSS